MDLHLPASMRPDKWAGYLPHKVNQSFSGKNVGNAERVISGALGLLMLGIAMRRRGAIGKAVMIPAGLAALKRAATGKCDIYQAAGLSSVNEKSEGKVIGLKTSVPRNQDEVEPLYI